MEPYDYVWREGRTPPRVDAETAAVELKRIYEKFNGYLIPDNVVEESKPVQAPLHGVFDWDDQKAADNWRRQQARLLIRSVQIEFADKSRQPVWVHTEILPPGRTQPIRFYQDASKIVERPDEWQVAVQEAERGLMQAAQRVDVLRALARARRAKKSQQQTLTLLAEALATARLMTEKLQ